MLHSGIFFQLTAKSDGILTMPAVLRRGLVLVPGDILSVQHFPLSVHLEIYREFLAERWEFFAPETRWEYLQQFLLRTLTAIDAKGRLPIPPVILRVRKGETFTLQVFCRGHVHSLFLSRIPPKLPPKHLSVRQAAGQAALTQGCGETI
jgi:hypothetical protein